MPNTLTAAVADRLAAPPRCWPQCQPADWADDREQPRKGWIRSSCSKCKTFIGYRPIETKQAAGIGANKP